MQARKVSAVFSAPLTGEKRYNGPMENENRIINEGVVLLFETPWSERAKAARDAIDSGLEESKSGRTLGSGVSLVYDDCVSVEVGAYAEAAADAAIQEALESVGCTDFEICWNER